jgi:ankyrin repeat protein
MTTSGSAPSAQLPSRPSLQLLSNLAKALRKDYSARDAAAIARLKTHHPRFRDCADEAIVQASITLRDAQLVIAREHGFEHRAAMKTQVLALQSAAAEPEAVEALQSAASRADVKAVRKLLNS